MKMIKNLSTIVLALLWFGAAASYHPPHLMAQNGFPEPVDRYINDFADIITAADESQIRRLLTDLEERSDVEGVVVTIESIDDYPTAESTLDSFGLGLFNAWGIGDRTANDGMLVLVALEDRELRIELGADNRNEYNVAVQRIIDDEMLPLFREGSFSQGILQGTESTIERIIGPRERAKQSGESTFPTPLPTVVQSSELGSTSSGSSGSGGGIPLWGWIVGLLVLIAVGVVGYNFYRINERTRPRKCPNCDDYMELLDEDQDDLHLDTGQLAEEYLKSVDYDVWVCPSDGATSIYPHESFWSKYSRCPTCSYRTVDKYDEVLDVPTVVSAGRKRVVADCSHCNYNRSEIVVLPRIQRQASVPRGRSGGGRSGGGWSAAPSPRRVSTPRRSRTFGGGRGGGGGGSGSW